MVILISLAAGCNNTENVKSNLTSGVPKPIYPSDKVMDELDKKFGNEPLNPVWIYFHDDFQNKCAQERALGTTCHWIK